VLDSQLDGAHDLRRLDLLVRNLAALADASVANLALLVRLAGPAIRSVAQLVDDWRESN